MLAVPASPTDAIRGILVVQGIAAEIESRAKAVNAQAQLVASLQKQTLVASGGVNPGSCHCPAKSRGCVEHTDCKCAQAAETTDLDTAARAAAATVTANAKRPNPAQA